MILLDNVTFEIRHLKMAYLQNKKLRIAIFTIFIANIILIFIHILSIIIKNMFLINPEYLLLLRIDEDRSIPEFFNYFQAFASAFILMKFFLTDRKIIFAALSVTLLAIGLDDMLEYHEIFGHVLAQTLDLPPLLGMRPQDSGELLAWFLVGTPLGLAIVLGLFRSDRQTLAFSILVIGVLVLLVAFAVGVDMLGIAIPPLLVTHGFDPVFVRGVYALMTIIEDGGEMLSLALCLSILLLRFYAGHPPETGRTRL